MPPTSSAVATSATPATSEPSSLSGDVTLPTDEELHLQAIAGDREAAGEILLRYREPALGLLRSMSIHPNDQEDVLNNAFVRFLRGLSRFDPTRGLLHWWFRRNVRWAGLSFTRDAARRLSMIAPVDPITLDLADTNMSADSTLDRHELFDAVAAAGERLSSEYREVLRLILAELSTREIATRLCITEGNVRVIRHRILRALEHNARLRAEWDALISREDALISREIRLELETTQREIRGLVRTLLERCPRIDLANLNILSELDVRRWARKLPVAERIGTKRDDVRQDEVLSSAMIARIVSYAFARLPAQSQKARRHSIRRTTFGRRPHCRVETVRGTRWTLPERP